MTYKINEIFYSLQGEGFNTGTPSVFVRFSGCTPCCSFCDTKHQQGNLMTADEIADEISRYPAPLIVLTGGEPSLFIDEEFVDIIKKKTGKTVAIETNGTHTLPSNIDWITLSPKFGFEGGDAHPCIITKCNELKVVFLGQDLSQYDSIETTHRFLQPCFVADMQQCQANMQACVDAVLHNPEWRLSLQVHRTLGIR